MNHNSTYKLKIKHINFLKKYLNQTKINTIKNRTIMLTLLDSSSYFNNTILKKIIIKN